MAQTVDSITLRRQRMGAAYARCQQHNKQALAAGRAVFADMVKRYNAWREHLDSSLTDHMSAAEKAAVDRWLVGCAEGGAADFVSAESREALAAKVVSRYPEDYTLEEVRKLERHQMLGESLSPISCDALLGGVTVVDSVRTCYSRFRTKLDLLYPVAYCRGRNPWREG